MSKSRLTGNDDVQIQLVGDEELNKIFEGLKANQQRSILLSTFRKASQPIVRAMKSNLKTAQINNRRKNLFKSLGVAPVNNQITLVIGARTRGGFKGYHANLINVGTKQRTTKKGWNRGAGRATHFFDNAIQSQENSTYEIIYKHFQDTILKFYERKASSLSK